MTVIINIFYEWTSSFFLLFPLQSVYYIHFLCIHPYISNVRWTVRSFFSPALKIIDRRFAARKAVDERTRKERALNFSHRLTENTNITIHRLLQQVAVVVVASLTNEGVRVKHHQHHQHHHLPPSLKSCFIRNSASIQQSNTLTECSKCSLVSLFYCDKKKRIVAR